MFEKGCGMMLWIGTIEEQCGTVVKVFDSATLVQKVRGKKL